MRHIQNTLYVTSDRAYLHKDGESIVVTCDKEKIGQFPIIAIGEIVCFGFGISVSAPLAEFCATRAVTISYLNGTGKFLARMVGPVQGNVLLRRRQYRDADDETRALAVAQCVIAAKTANQRNVLLRFLRNHPGSDGAEAVSTTVERLGQVQRKVAATLSREQLRALEGEGAAYYFSAFDKVILVDSTEFEFRGRTRRPPTDRVNALLSFAYSLLALDLRSALEAVGLDPYVGFLHVERPGRPSLALDIAEEFRAAFADRLVLSLINRRQIDAAGFSIAASGEVAMTAQSRKTFLAAYQQRKRETIVHPFLGEEMEVGVAFVVQARLLARYVRGDIDLYPAFLWR
jgi:CRISPR-associated protein Cas1